ncbi:hypothetical protein Tco_0499211, partial [Tanacetum coccineum]
DGRVHPILKHLKLLGVGTCIRLMFLWLDSRSIDVYNAHTSAFKVDICDMMFTPIACRTSNVRVVTMLSCQEFGMQPEGFYQVLDKKFHMMCFIKTVTCGKNMTPVTEGDLEVSELAACLEEASLSCTPGHVEVF